MESPVRPSARVIETRDSVESSFAPCPEHLLREASRLGGLPDLQRFRVERAWRAGLWAGATIQGRVPSPPLDVRPRIYVILRGGIGRRPAAFSTGGPWVGPTLIHQYPTLSRDSLLKC